MEGILTEKGAADSADHGVEGHHTSDTRVASMPVTLALEAVGSTKVLLPIIIFVNTLFPLL